MPANVIPLAVAEVLMVPPNRFNMALASTLTPVPAVAVMVPSVLSTLISFIDAEEMAIPAVVLVMVPSFLILTVPVPLCVAEIPVAAVISPAERI